MRIIDHTWCNTVKFSGKKALLLLMLALFGISSQAQVAVKVTTDKDRILIGEPVVISVDVYTPAGAQVNWFRADTIPHFEIMNRSLQDTAENMDGKHISQTITVTSFDSGRWQIPAFEVIVAGQPYYSDTLSVDVAFVSFDPKQDYRDIKDIIEVVPPSMRFIPWMVAAAALLSLAVLVFMLRKSRTVKTEKQSPQISLSAYEEAIRSLSSLKEKDMTQLGMKPYYSTLNDILRTYVAKTFRIATFEKTNEELLMQLSGKIPKDTYSSLTQSLRMSDVVKFAKFVPSEEDNHTNIAIVRSTIDLLNTNVSGAV